jgi:hypothetical protein
MNSKLFAFYMTAIAQGKLVLYRQSIVAKMSYDNTTDVLSMWTMPHYDKFVFKTNDLINGSEVDFHCPLDDFIVAESIYDKLLGV